jgi:hypothetical protein
MFKIKKKFGKPKPTILYNVIEDYSEFDAPGSVPTSAMNRVQSGSSARSISPFTPGIFCFLTSRNSDQMRQEAAPALARDTRVD